MGFPDESEYQGGTTSGELIHGIFAFSNHEVYDGEWREGLRHGNGCFTPKDGGEYDGSWDHGERHGAGKQVYPSGDVYRGGWHAGARSGRGELLAGDGSRYEGLWARGERDGKGAWRGADGSTYEGDWEAGVRSGEGTAVGADGETYAGEWEGGVRSGVAHNELNSSMYVAMMRASRMWLSTTGPVDLVGTRYFEVMATGTTLCVCNRLHGNASAAYSSLGLVHERTVVMFDSLEEFEEIVANYTTRPEYEARRMAIVRRAQALARRHFKDSVASRYCRLAAVQDLSRGSVQCRR